MRPTDEQSNFGFCEKCGIVYALRARTTDESGEQAQRTFEREFGNKAEAARSRTAAPDDTGERPRAPAFLWRCPDCEAELRADNDVDLEFLKRGHIRDYHPNR